MRENNLKTMPGEDWLTGLRRGDYAGLASQLESIKRLSYPLLNGPYCMQHLLVPQADPDFSAESRMLRILQDRYDWQLDTDALLRKEFQAIIVTNSEQEVVWASDGFSEMTGYSAQFATGRRLSFLQGPETSEITKETIREHIRQEKKIVTTIVNYRRNGEAYQCRVAIEPIRNSTQQVTHFLALETELV